MVGTNKHGISFTLHLGAKVILHLDVKSHLSIPVHLFDPITGSKFLLYC